MSSLLDVSGGNRPFNVISPEQTRVVTLRGHLDVYACKEVESQLPEPLTCERVVIDCSQAESIDSSVITVLLRYRRRFEGAGREPLNIVVVAAPNIRRVFEVTGVSRLLTVIAANLP